LLLLLVRLPQILACSPSNHARTFHKTHDDFARQSCGMATA